LKAWSAERGSSTVAKGRTHGRFSSRVRTNRSAPRSRCAGRRTGSAVALRLAREGRRARDAEGADLGPEVVADAPAAVIVAQPQAGGDVPGERAAALAHRLPDRLERLEAIGAATGVGAGAPGRAVVDGHEHRGPALAGHHRGQVGAPHQADPLGGDRAVVGLRAARMAGTLVGEQAVLAREPQDAAPAGAEAGEAQPGPELAVTLAVGRAVRQELSDRRCRALVRYGAARPGPLRARRPPRDVGGGRRSPATRPRGA